jgi:aspartyl-tRNA(Asn)/glutamyl-tRNA(Gln) amidotransferase subunit A
LDHCGPITRTVADAALALKFIAGYDPKDPCSKDVTVPDYCSSLTGDIRGVKVGVPDTFYFDQIESVVKAHVERGIHTLKDLGAEIRSVHIPDLEEAQAVTFLIILAEAASCLEKFHRTRSSDIGDDVRHRLDLGALVLATHYIKAQRIRRRIQTNFSRVLRQVDVLVTPGVSIIAPQLDQSTVRIDGNDIPVVAALPHCTRIYDLVGIPSISIREGFSSTGLPIGMQFAGRPFDEATVLKVADAYERHIYRPTPWPTLS